MEDITAFVLLLIYLHRSSCQSSDNISHAISNITNQSPDDDSLFCGEIFTGVQETIKITLPTQNGTYSPNMLCRWELKGDEKQYWGVTSSHFSVEHSSDCSWDYLMIRDGGDNNDHFRNTFCGYDELSFLSETNHLLLYFKSDGSLQDAGFTLEITAFQRDNGSLCSKVVETEGILASPNYPRDYPPGSHCVYWLKSPTEKHRVRIGVQDLALEDTACVYDHISIFDGSNSHAEKVIDMCGGEIGVTELTSSGQDMLIIFVTDLIGEERGFSFEVTFVEDTDKFEILSIDDEDDCSKVIDVVNEGIISSPGFPYNYPNNMRCVVIIRAPTNTHVKLTVTFLELEGSANCSYDSLEIFSDNASGSKSLRKMCGHSSESMMFISEYNTLRLELVTDEYISWRGYSANYTVIPNEGCLPYCSENTVCIKENGLHRCVTGSRCEFNVCDTGECVRNQQNITCFCPANVTGPLCEHQVVKEETKADVFPPQSTDQPHTLAFHKGEKALIPCRIDLTEATYTWVLNHRMILGDSGIVEHLNGSLEITNFDQEYIGTYQCLASNWDTFLQTVTNVTLVQGCDTEWVNEPQEMSVDVGSDLHINCFLEDAVSVRWYFDDVEIIESIGTEITENGSRLSVEHVEQHDQGLYTCMVNRSNGCATSRTTMVTVSQEYVDDGICGRPSIPEMMPRFLGRISRGDTIIHGTSPWHVILRDRRDRSTFCGGTLLSKSWMVTAAHCTSNDHFSREFNKSFDAQNIDLYLGTDFCNGTNGQKRGILRYIPYPHFGQRAPYDNDIALIEFDKPIEYTNTIKPICLESLRNVESTFMNRRFGRSVGKVVGCGRIHERIADTPPYLRDVFVPYVDRRLCSNARIGTGNFTDSMFCAGYNRAYLGDACAGDSGGSLTMQRSDTGPWYLIGIVSWGVGCDRPGQYGYYTHVAKFLHWIGSVTGGI